MFETIELCTQLPSYQCDMVSYTNTHLPPNYRKKSSPQAKFQKLEEKSRGNKPNEQRSDRRT